MKPIMLLLTFFFLFFVVICDVEQAKKPKNIGFKYSERTKIDCGFVGINQKKCEEKGCYFKISLDGTPWCYYIVELNISGKSDDEDYIKSEGEHKLKPELENIVYQDKTLNESFYGENEHGLSVKKFINNSLTIIRDVDLKDGNYSGKMLTSSEGKKKHDKQYSSFYMKPRIIKGIRPPINLVEKRKELPDKYNVKNEIEYHDELSRKNIEKNYLYSHNIIEMMAKLKMKKISEEIMKKKMKLLPLYNNRN